MQADAHENGGVVEHPRDVPAVAEAVAIVVVAAVVDEERIVAVLAKAAPRVFRRDRSGLAAVAGHTGAAVSAERLALEEAFPFPKIAKKSP